MWTEDDFGIYEAFERYGQFGQSAQVLMQRQRSLTYTFGHEVMWSSFVIPTWQFKQ
jgi:hypothetical protein